MSFFTELKRRNVFKVGVAYAIVAWLLIQIVATVFPILALPEWTIRFITILIIIGFPLALILAWIYELTPEGIKVTTSEGPAQYHTQTTGQRLNYFIIGVLVLVVAFLVVKDYVLKESPEVVRETQGTSTMMETVSPEKESQENREPTAPPNSIAVLPFVNFSEDKKNEYFADGVSEEILNSLARIKELEVRGRTSSFYFKDKNEELITISKMLNVEYVLEGSVRRAGEQVRVTVQMINAREDEHIWSKTYERTLNDIFAIQDDIAKSVADTLEITLGIGELGRESGMTRNVEAYDAYLDGRFLKNQPSRENISQAIEQCEHAVALDPKFAIAWDELGEAYENAAFTYVSEKAEEYSKKAKAAYARALDLAPNSPSSLFATASQHFRHREWVAAEQSFKKVLAQKPKDSQMNSLYGLYLVAFGRPGDAIVYFQRAVRAEPLFVTPALQLGLAYLYSGDLDAALKQYDHARKLIVGDTSIGDSSMLLLAMIRHDQALVKTYAKKPGTMLPPENRSLLSTLGTHLDKPKQARSILYRFYEDPTYHKNSLMLGVIGMWSAYFDDQELALKAYQDASKSPTFLLFTLWSPILKEMRRLPGFKDIVREWKLVDYWRETGNWGEFCHPVGRDDFECN